ncbi:MAG: GerMN domain-containing protein [Eubacteriales bacterium]|nr:GerMN domain-containing protein [Eubacteriales bacterium]
MRRIIAKSLPVLLLILLLAGLSGCGKSSADKRGIKLYYLNKTDLSLQEEDYTPKADGREEIVDELINKLSIQPKEMTLRAPVDGFKLISAEMTGKVIVLNFTGEYYDMDVINEVMTRTAIINTLCSFMEVDGVRFQVEGQTFKDLDGEEPGVMTPEQFIYNSYTEMRNYVRVRLHLFFASESGDRLVDSYRTVVYNSNLPLERLVVEQVIAGPNSDFAFGTVNPETKVLNVTTRDNICFVDLSSEFQNDPYSVTAQVAIYSIVNSLCGLDNVRGVQISVNGQPDAVFMENYSLTGTFVWNEEIIEMPPGQETEEGSERPDNETGDNKNK